MTHCLLVFMFSKFKAVIVKKTNLLTYSHLSYRRCFFSCYNSSLFQYFIYWCKCYYYAVIINLKLKHEIKQGGEKRRKRKRKCRFQ